MLNQILQEIKSVPSLVPIYWKAMLIVLHNKYAIQQSLDILIRVKTTRARCAEMLTTLEGYYAELGSTINNNSVIFIKSINFSGLINDALNVLSSCYGVELLEAKQIRIFLDAYGLNIEISNSNELGEKKDALIETLFRTICLLRTLKDTLENNISTEITYYLQQQSISVSEYADVIGIVENMVRYIDVILATVPRHQVYEMLSKVPESRGIIMYNYIYGICAEGHEKSLPSELERAVQLVQLKNRQSIITSFQGDTIYYPEERVYQALPLPIYPVILVNEDNCRTFPRPNQSNPEIIATKPALSEKEKKFLELYCGSVQNHLPLNLDKRTGLRPSVSNVPHEHKVSSGPALKRSISVANFTDKTDDSNTLTGPVINFFRKAKDILRTNKLKKTQSMSALNGVNLQETPKIEYEYGRVQILTSDEKLKATASGRQGIFTALSRSPRGKPARAEYPFKKTLTGLPEDLKGEKLAQKEAEKKTAEEEKKATEKAKKLEKKAAEEARRAAEKAKKLEEKAAEEERKAEKKAKKKSSKKRRTVAIGKARQKSIEDNDFLDEQCELVATEKKQTAQCEAAKDKEKPTLRQSQFNQLTNDFNEKYFPNAEKLLNERIALNEEELSCFLGVLKQLQDNTVIFLNQKSGKKNRELRILKSNTDKFRDMVIKGIMPMSISSYIKVIDNLSDDESLRLIYFSRFYIIVRALAQYNLEAEWLGNFEPSEYQDFLKTLEALAESYFIFIKEGNKTDVVETKCSFKWMQDRVYYLKDVFIIYQILKEKDVLNGKEDTLRSIVVRVEELLKSMQIKEENKVNLIKKIQPQEEHCKRLLELTTRYVCNELSTLLISVVYENEGMGDLWLKCKSDTTSLEKEMLEKGVCPFLLHNEECMAFESILNNGDSTNIILCIKSIDKWYDQLISDDQLTTVFNLLSQFLARSNGGALEVREAIKKLFKARINLKDVKLNASSTVGEDISFKSLQQQSNNIHSFYKKQKNSTMVQVSEAADSSNDELKKEHGI